MTCYKSLSFLSQISPLQKPHIYILQKGSLASPKMIKKIADSFKQQIVFTLSNADFNTLKTKLGTALCHTYHSTF